jgi:hypothetical protein
MSRIDTALARIESRLDDADALAAVAEAWVAETLAAAPPVPDAARSRVARLLAESGESA